MTIEEMKNNSFPIPTLADWRVLVEASLKGKPADSLQTNTYENITLKPIYTRDMGSHDREAEFPGQSPYTRGIAAAGYHEFPWRITQPVVDSDAGTMNAKVKEVLSRGQNIIALHSDSLRDLSLHDTKLLFDGLPLDEVPIYIDDPDQLEQLLATLKLGCEINGIDYREMQGVAAEDPIAKWAASGYIPADCDVFFKDWFSAIKNFHDHVPQLRTIKIETSVFHSGGANSVQELAYGLAVAAEYLEQGQKNGMKLEDLTNNIIFSFAIDSDFFMNIAKLRAARRIWGMFADAYGVSREYFKMHIHAETSSRTETLYDRHVNILRGANQAFAAVIGGIQYLTVHPFNRALGKASAMAERLARNTQLILKEESHIRTVVDPAGGSFYVEQLTDELTELAWAAFLDITDKGGIIAGLKTGQIQKETKEILHQRLKRAAVRKERIIGTNVYPKDSDKVEVQYDNKGKTVFVNCAVEVIEAIEPIRLAEIFEEIRLRSLAYETRSGKSVQFGLINLKQLKSYKPRADFIKEAAASGGIEALGSKGCETIEDMKAFVGETDIRSYCLCGSDTDYMENAKLFVEEFKRSYPEKRIYLAGKPDKEMQETLLQAGLNGFVHARSNMVEFLDEVLAYSEVKE